MTRYVSRPRSSYDDDTPILTGSTVYEADSSPERTGLLDAAGNPLFRVQDRVPLGFHAKRAPKA